MRRLILIILVLFSITLPVEAMDFTAPLAPEPAQENMPDQTENFGEGLLYILRSGFDDLQPSVLEAVKTCVSVISVSLLVGLVTELSGTEKQMVSMVGTVSAAIILFQPVNAMIQLGISTVQQISQYGKLLLPVMTGALAAQGAVTKSGSVYLATAFFDALLSSAVSELLIPLVYIFLCVSSVCNLYAQPLLSQIQKFLKWLMTWGLKSVLYVFTGYISITGVVGGATDAAMLKVTKLTISGMVPVVGNILSDASEAVLVSAGIMKNTAGIYGLLAMTALLIGPFMRIGLQYLMLKVSGSICEMFGTKQMSGVVKDFSSAMGLILAMTGTVSLIFLISTICFMKGVG